MTTQILNFSFNKAVVSFRNDGYLNATEIAQSFGKATKDYLKTERTQEYIAALIEFLSDGKKILSQSDLVIVKKGNSKNFTQGTWLHPKLAIDFARWLNPKFAVWCDFQIEKILGINQEQVADRLTDEQVGYLYNQVMRICGETGQAYQTVFGSLKRHFQVASYKHIKASDFAEACKWLGVPLPIEKEEKLSKPLECIDDKTLINIGRVLLHAQDMRQFVSRYLPAFENLGIDKEGALWSYVHDTEPAFEHVRHFFTARCPALGHWAWDSNLDWIHRRILSTVDV